MALLSAIDISQNANRLTGRPINAQTGTTYTLVLTDAGKLVTLSNASSITVTVPTNASVAFPVGSEVYLAQIGAGAVAVAGDTGVTVNAPDSDLSFDPQYTHAKLTKTGTNTWLFSFLGGSGAGSETVDMGTCQGRLTLSTGVPVTTSDVTAATTVYFTPFRGELVALYTGAAWVYHTLTELSVSVPATTNTMYDVFLDYNGGSPTLATTAWTNDTTRATALTTQDGVYVQTGNTDWRYLGSFRTTGVSGQTEDSLTKRYVFNYYNRVHRPLRRVDTTNSWTYTTASFQQANASTSNQVEVVTGVSEGTVTLTVIGQFTNSTSTIRYATVGVGVDSTSANSASVFAYVGGSSTIVGNTMATYNAIPSVGRHFYAWLEYGGASDTTTWYGDNNGSIVQTGISGSCWA